MPPGTTPVPERGDVCWLDPAGTQGREQRGERYVVVVSPREINRLGVCVTVAVTTGGEGQRSAGTAVNITSGGKVTGVAVCNQIRAYDLQDRVRSKTARFVECLPRTVADLVADTAASVISPG